MIRPQSLLTLFAILLPLVFAAGPWTPVNPNDPDVKRIGEFAVSENNKQTGTKLVFQRVVSGNSTPRGAGLWYQIIIAASSENYLVSVWDRPFLPLELHAFVKVKN